MTLKERVNLYVNWACAIAKDDSHGYSQVNRWSPDYDCSSFVISALEQAGFEMRKNGASYTGNMMTALLRCGFKLVMDKRSPLLIGDVLLTHTDARQHTAIYIGDGRIVHARGANGHNESGDQTGQEITISQYYQFEMVFRLDGLNNKESEVVNVELETIRRGVVGHNVKVLQILLNSICGFYLEVDGVCGQLTVQAIECYQRNREYHKNVVLVDDGVCGQKTWNAILNNK